MTQQPLNVEGNALQKIGGAGFIIGGILFLMSGLLMPYAAKPTSNLQQMLTPLGEHAIRTEVASLLIAIGFWAAMAGAVGLYRSITAAGAAWARVGFYLIVVGTVLWTISLSLDVAVASAVADWLAAPADAKAATWSVVAALSAVGRGLLPVTWIAYWLALGLLGMAMRHSTVYPRWLSWVGLTVSMSVIALGIIQTFTARSTPLTLVFSVLMMLTALWDLTLGVWVARRAWAPTVMHKQVAFTGR